MMSLEDRKNYLIQTVSWMRMEFEGDYTPLAGDDYKMENLQNEYNRLIAIDTRYGYTY